MLSAQKRKKGEGQVPVVRLIQTSSSGDAKSRGTVSSILFNPKAHWTLIARVLTLTARVLDLKHVAV